MARVRVKICGIMRFDDAQKASEYGADAIGFVFYKKSKRYISPSKVRKIVEDLPPFTNRVGVFVNERIGKVRDVVKFCNLDTVQLHGDEDHHFCHRLKRYGFRIIKAFRVGPDFDFDQVRKYKVDALLFDTLDDTSYGGTGKVFQWEMLQKLKTDVPVIVSGGLTLDNLPKAIKAAEPFGVDVSSSIEKSVGVKSHTRMRQFIESCARL